MLALVNYTAHFNEGLETESRYMEIYYPDGSNVDLGTIKSDLLKFDRNFDRNKEISYSIVNEPVVFIKSKYPDIVSGELFNDKSIEMMKKILEIDNFLKLRNYILVEFMNLNPPDINVWIAKLAGITFIRVPFANTNKRYLVMKCYENDVIMNLYKLIVSRGEDNNTYLRDLFKNRPYK